METERKPLFDFSQVSPELKALYDLILAEKGQLYAEAQLLYLVQHRFIRGVPPLLRGRSVQVAGMVWSWVMQVHGWDAQTFAGDATRYFNIYAASSHDVAVEQPALSTSFTLLTGQVGHA